MHHALFANILSITARSSPPISSAACKPLHATDVHSRMQGVRAGQTDGAIQFTVLRAMQTRTADDIPLDKPAVLH